MKRGEIIPAKDFVGGFFVDQISLEQANVAAMYTILEVHIG